MRLDKIYTKVGDKGKTMLASGVKVAKDSTRIDAYGTVDELNSVIGLLKDSLSWLEGAMLSESHEKLRRIQNQLFDLGGELATPNEVLDINKQQVINQESIVMLESEIDDFNLQLEPLANFILPGGHTSNSYAHLARCVCRRAERLTVKLSGEEDIRPETLIYLNRLSDWLFVFARILSKYASVEEILWQQEKKR